MNIDNEILNNLDKMISNKNINASNVIVRVMLIFSVLIAIVKIYFEFN